MENNNNGQIPSIDSDRGDVELKGKGKRNKKFSKSDIQAGFFFGGLIVALLSGAIWYTWDGIFSSSKNEVIEEADPTLQKKAVDKGKNKNIDTIMLSIAEKQREKEMQEQKLREEEERRNKDLQAQREKELLDALQAKGRLSGNEAGGNSTGVNANNIDENGEPIFTPEMRKKGAGKFVLTFNSPSAEQEDDGISGGSLNGDNLNKELSGGQYPNGKASILKDRSLLLGKGTFMPCVLKTKMVSTYKSMTMCQLTKDVYSNDGSTVLMEGGTIFYGEMNRILLQGQARIFVAWNEAETPNGIRVKIDSLGTDSLGASGLAAFVDDHFWERFKGAFLISFVNDALATASNRLSKDNNNGVNINNSTNTAGEMATIALENSINIPPTGYINQGALVSILVPRDIYFNNVYKLK